MSDVRLSWLALASPAVAGVKVGWLELAPTPSAVAPILESPTPPANAQVSWLSLAPTPISTQPILVAPKPPANAQVSWLSLGPTPPANAQVSWLSLTLDATSTHSGGFDDGKVRKRRKRFIVNIDGKQLSFAREQDAIDALDRSISKQLPIGDKRDRQGELDAVSAIIAKATLQAAMELRQQDEDDIELLLLSL